MSATRRLRVLVVDDSAVQRQMISGLLGSDPELEVAGFAANGAEALDALEKLKPDVVTLDEKMPVLSGIETARRIMRERPTPIVMITQAGGARGRDIADAALAAGVLSVQDKRGLASGETAAAAELVRAVKSMAAVRLVRRRRDPSTAATLTLPRIASAKPDIVAIGASTGGPQAIRTVLAPLPADFKLPILVVQHTTAGYANTLVDWLRAEIHLPVQVAVAGQHLAMPGVYVAPTERHMVVQGRHLELLDTPPSSLHRPSATVLFRSVAHAYGPRAIGVLLTGMGDDGAVGLTEMKQAGAMTVAQEESSCVVFGMPAEAIRMGGVDHVLRPDQIPTLLMEQAR